MKKEIQIKQIKEKYDSLKEVLNEYTKRLWAGTESIALGRGGQEIVRLATGINKNTISAGVKEIKEGIEKLKGGKMRKAGGGRKKAVDKDESLIGAIENIVNSSTRGDPESPLLRCSKSTRKIAEELKKKGKKVSHMTISIELGNMGYSLQGNRKTQEGGTHEDRDKQFNFISEKTKKFQYDSQPVISVDTKKKENIGNFKNNGKEYCKKGSSPEVNVYDFIDKELGKVSPYGIYDLDKNKGWVSVGISSDTAEFAVNSIRSWWGKMGKEIYKEATKIYINADGGGSNGSRVRLWKTEIQELANELKMEIHISHFPPGTSKWNKIEHRMFSMISNNWRGKPLIDRATVVNLIGNTTTTTGLKIQAELDEKIYEKGIKVSDEELSKVNLHKEDFHGEWNYIIKPIS